MVTNTGATPHGAIGVRCVRARALEADRHIPLLLSAGDV